MRLITARTGVDRISAVTLSQELRGTELQLTLRPAHTQPTSIQSGNSWDQFTIFVREGDGWVECCSGAIAVEYQEVHQSVSEVNARDETTGAMVQSINAAMAKCNVPPQFRYLRCF